MTPAWTPEAIRALRQHLRWTQAQLAREIGVSLNTVTRWEAGGRAPNHWHALRLARLAGGSPARDLMALDLDLELERATADAAGAGAMDAVAHAEARELSPLALALAGNAAIEHAHGATAADWLLSKQSLPRDRLERAVSELIGAGLWPWGR